MLILGLIFFAVMLLVFLISLFSSENKKQENTVIIDVVSENFTEIIKGHYLELCRVIKKKEWNKLPSYMTRSLLKTNSYNINNIPILVSNLKIIENHHDRFKVEIFAKGLSLSSNLYVDIKDVWTFVVLDNNFLVEKME